VTPLDFGLWLGIALHNPNYDDQFRESVYAASIEARATYKRAELSLTHKSIPDERDYGQTWIEVKYRIW